MGCVRLVSHHADISPGCGYLAWPGHRFDPRSHIEKALAQGARACLIEAQGATLQPDGSEAVATYSQLKAHAGEIAHHFLNQPSHHLRVLAVTGTNGKTSTAWWLASALNTLGHHCALVGTLGAYPPGQLGTSIDLPVQGALLTTPDALALQAQWHSWREQGVQSVAMEASSIGLAEHRLSGTRVDTALFTNLTRDHLDYHGTMQAYGQAKRLLFTQHQPRAAVINIDDPFGRSLADELAHTVEDLWTVSRVQADDGQTHARLTAQSLSWQDQGVRFDLCEAGRRLAVTAPVVGAFNVQNLLLVAAALRSYGHALEVVAHTLSQLQAVPGRLQPVPCAASGPRVWVDYAHTPDALEQVLAALRPLGQQRGGRVWCVFGCGGDRDRGKRALMGEVASRCADVSVITSDNPRSEDPDRIVQDILQGVDIALRRHCVVEVDRAQAIAYAIAQAGGDDVVLIAGKGHEPTQEIGGQRHPFVDAHHAQRALARRQAV